MRGPCKEWVTSRASAQEAGRRSKGARLDRRGPGAAGEAGLPGAWVWVGRGSPEVVESGGLALWVSSRRGLGLHASFVTY